MFEIVNTLSEENYEKEFVAIGAYIDDLGIPRHSVFIIKYKDQLYQFHYTSREILFNQDIRKECFHKVTHTIPPVLIPSFIMMCKQILKKANPRYGYFYSGEYFDFDGNHFSDQAIGQTMTCAGFVLNVLKGFHEKDYINYTEWLSTSHDVNYYVENYARRFSLNPADIEISHRRISPLDLICSAFFSKMPIPKADIDSMKPIVSDFFEQSV